MIGTGQSWVALFFVLLGFVNSLKPIKQARAGNLEGALHGLSTASFRRSFRLVLPAATSTILSWALTQLGFYEISRQADAYWLQSYTPAPSLSWGTALEDLVYALKSTWLLQKDNLYDQPQWALVYLLQGSIIIFFVLLATVSLSAKWRVFTVAACILWSFDWTIHLLDPMVGFTVLGGTLLAELNHTSYPSRLASFQSISMVLAPFLVIVSLVLMSIPSNDAQSMPWSWNLVVLFAKIFPEQAMWDVTRVIASSGALLLCLSIMCSPQLRRLLSARPLRWLGKLSFPIYLLHAAFMRSIMAWIIFGGRPMAEFIEHAEDGTEIPVMRYMQPGPVRIWIGIIVGMSSMLLAAHVWANKLEPMFGRITAWAESHMQGKNDGLGILNGKPEGSPKEG